jgi:hypothetical protein
MAMRLALVLCLVGCSPASPPPPVVAATSSVSAPPPTVLPPAPPRPTVGLDAASSDAGYAKLIRAVASCNYNPALEDADTGCPPQKQLDDHQAHDDTLFNALEDGDPLIRRVAVQRLRTRAEAYARDKARVERLLIAAEKQQPEVVDLRMLGRLVGQINVADTGTWSRVKALLEKGPQPMRLGIVERALAANDANRDVYDHMVALTRDPAPEMRREAFRAFWVGGSHFQDDTCKLYAANFENADDEMAGLALTNAAGFHGKCAALYDKVLAVVDRRLKERRINSGTFGYAISYLTDKASSHPTDLQQKKAAAMARALVDDLAADPNARVACLEALHRLDPAATAPLLRKLKTDKSSLVIDAVMRLSKP